MSTEPQNKNLQPVGNECVNCAHYSDDHCRKLDLRRPRSVDCAYFKIRLADHYVPNMWDEWKAKASRREMRNEK